MPEPGRHVPPSSLASAPNHLSARGLASTDGAVSGARVRIRTKTCDKLCHGAGARRYPELRRAGARWA